MLKSMLRYKVVATLIVAALGVFALPVQAQTGDNNQLSLAWHEASDFEFVRGYVFSAGIDIDQDGKGEILTYDGDGGKKTVYLFEATADNSYALVWSYQFTEAGIVGGERGIFVTDLDNDGFDEITVIIDSYSPDSTFGFNAGNIFEWDGTDNGIPATPTATFDPPRDALGQVRLEYNTQALDLDSDGKTEILMTHRGGNGTFLSIIEVTSADLAGGVTVTVEFEDKFTLPGTAADTVHYQMKNTGFGITDIDRDGLSEILMFDDNTGLVRVYEGTGANAYAFVAEWQPAPTGWVAGATVKSHIPAADLDKDGVQELYLADNKGNTWVISPAGAVATMFDDANWTLLHDWKVGAVYNEGGEIRGSLLGDVDRDGKPDIYFAGNNFAAIMDMEYDGGAVTDGDNYSYYLTAIDAIDAVDGGHFARASNIALSDMDGDGHLEVTAIVPWTGGNPVANLRGLYVFEHDLTTAADIALLGDNSKLGFAWHEASDDVFVRGYVFSAGIDIDQDGKGEILTYDGDGGKKTVYLFEATADNTYEVAWSYQFTEAGIVGGERGIFVTDLDNDGFDEITVIIDSYSPDSTFGFNAGNIFEWDGTDNGIPATPTATFDPPRDALGQVRLEYNTQALDLDSDGKTEILMTHRGGNGTFLSIIEVTSADLAGGVTVTVEFEDKFTLPGTAADTVHYQMKNTGFGITDIDRDGLSEILMFDDNTGLVRVYEGTGANAYAFVAEWQPAPTGWVAGATVKSHIPAADLDKDGVQELYLADNKGNTWVISPAGAVATMFADSNWTLLHDWKIGNVYNEGGEIRGSLLGDADRDNKPDIYFAGNNFASIMDMEYDGGAVTDGDNYSYYLTAIWANDAVDGGYFARASNIALSDMDGDGNLEVVAIVPWTGGNPVANLRGLYVYEYGASGAVGIVDRSSESPMTYSLHQNYPNPFNPVTNIAFDIPKATHVSLKIYDLLGRNVRTLLNEQKSPASYVAVWDGRDNRGSKVSSAVYFYRLETEHFTTTKKMLLLK